MKKYIKIIILGVLLSFVYTSCSDDFTKVDPIGLINEDDFLTTDDEAESVIYGIYDIMAWNYNRPWHSAYFLKVLPGDCANAAGGNSGDQSQLQQIDDFEHVADNPSITGVWEGYYKTIGLANVLIEKLEASDLSSKDKFIAEAKFLRAYSYFELVTLFGDVPLRITTPQTIDEFGLARSPKSEVYAQIESDLDAAINGLPVNGAKSQPFRVSKEVAQAVLGKVYLFQEKYGDAAIEFANVISSNAFDLEPNFADVWETSTEHGIESLFELSFVSTEQYDWGNFPWGGRPESNIHAQLMGPRGDGIFDVAAIGIANGWGFNLPTSKIGLAYDDEGDTVRKGATVISEEELIAAGGSVTPPDSGIHDYEGYVRLKYVTKTQDTDGPINELNYGVNWRLLRYADVLLMAAEAYHKNNEDGKALIELNKVRDRAGLDDITATGSALFDAIVKERQLELAFEGQRFWDLVRWGMADAELSSYGYQSKHQLYPIPTNEISRNSLISPEDQNPGY
ncbi:Starch-binding associating with outer membrane [Lutibacter oricola]|uniref:Starch-binding associating with outer membrane n=1 Tax=Lutibacter oricola TaxID=762486 RepID=A0A1H2S4F6_9FLAO|nr:RagB/SusD family nutrient uptake outer membrane protein [Lutibacter oricola]SDW26426.1 Starch-binding associating with outer membrane [Lutibacter oricola]